MVTGHGSWIDQALKDLASLADGKPKRVRLVTGTGTPEPSVTLRSMIEDDVAEGAVFYLLVCRECGNGDLVMPFSSPDSRSKWAGAHTRGTGHDRWFVTDTAALRADGLGDRPADVITAMARHDEAARRLREGGLP